MTGPHGVRRSPAGSGWGSAGRRVLVIDLVRAYTDPGGPFELPDAGAGGRGDRGSWSTRPGRHGRPVVWTVVRYAPGLADGGLFVRKVPALACFAEDAPGGWGELTAAARTPGSRCVVKQYASAFFGTSLAVDPARAPAWTPW